MNKGADREDQDESTVEVLLVPNTPTASSDPGETPVNGDGAPDSSPPNKAKVQEIYEALCHCAELHPDPSEDEDGQGEGGILGGGDPMAALSSGGWITSENAHEFEGSFPDVDIGDAGAESEGVVLLGPGAGSRRARDEAEESVPVNGDDETKWQRTG